MGLITGMLSSNGTISITQTGNTVNLEVAGTAATRQGTINIVAPANGTLVLISYAEYPFTIDSFDNLQVASGSITLTVNINGVPVTGMNGVNVTTTPQSLIATGNNTVPVGARLTAVLSSNSSSAGLEGTMKGNL